MSQLIYEFENRLNWDLVREGTYTRPNVGNSRIKSPIYEVTVPMESYIAMVGVRVPNAKPTWRLGGFANMRLNVLPSTLSSFVALAQTARQALRLGIQNIVRFPNLGANHLPYFLMLEFPVWFETVEIEIWTYSGIDTDSLSVQMDNYADILSRLEAKIDNL